MSTDQCLTESTHKANKGISNETQRYANHRASALDPFRRFT